MSEPYLSEIRIFGFNFSPRGWAQCDGQVLPINQNQSLYSLLGTTYGGDGRTTFALPDLRGRCAMHPGNGISQGQRSGEETHSLTADEMPAHLHTLQASNSPGDTPIPGAGNRLAAGSNLYVAGSPSTTTLQSDTVSHTGAGAGHDNMQPWQAVNFCIALQGTFPSRN